MVIVEDAHIQEEKEEKDVVVQIRVQNHAQSLEESAVQAKPAIQENLAVAHQFVVVQHAAKVMTNHQISNILASLQHTQKNDDALIRYNRYISYYDEIFFPKFFS